MKKHCEAENGTELPARAHGVKMLALFGGNWRKTVPERKAKAEWVVLLSAVLWVCHNTGCW